MTAASRPARSAWSGTTLRWCVLGLLLGIIVASLGWVAWTVVDRGEGGNPVARVDSLIDPAPDASRDRETALAAARTFVQRFETYGPDLLDAQQKMPRYAAVADLMTAKFAKVFKGNVGYAEQTVVETGIDRSATVYAVGVAAIDDDSAELLVAGVREFSYPDPDDAEERIAFAPQQFRYQVSLVRSGGSWRVDDLDDVDDSLGSFADSADQPGGGATPGPTDPAGTDPAGPTDPASPAPSGSASEGPGDGPSDGDSGGATP